MILVYVDNFHKRILEHFEEYTGVIFIDSTSSLERFNLPVFVFSISTPYGGYPIGLCISSDETYDTLVKAFYQLKQFGINLTVGMTDDCKSLRSALKTTWPSSNLILCTWHHSQALWTWMMETKNGVKKESRNNLMDEFLDIVHCKEKGKLAEMAEVLLSKHNSLKRFCERIENEMKRKEIWCHAYRGTIY